jgi:AraC family L-rhamnose operon regulatory protein RhaS
MPCHILLIHFFPSPYSESAFLQQSSIMSNSPYFIHWSGSPDIAPFLNYFIELGLLKFSGIHEHSLDMHCNDGIKICYILKGTHTWQVDDKCYQLYPGDGFITCPWQRHGNPLGRHERGVVSWMIIRPEIFERSGKMKLGEWSRLMATTQNHIGRLFAGNKSALIPQAGSLLSFYRSLNDELVSHQTGYVERINLILDSMLVETARLLERTSVDGLRHDGWLETLRERMNYWAFEQRVTMDKMAYSFNMSQSTFEKKVRFLTGFTPSEYLSKLRLEKAKMLLAQNRLSIKEIASQSGFSSSQYFAVSFAKWQGMSPSEYRENMKHEAEEGFPAFLATNGV